MCWIGIFLTSAASYPNNGNKSYFTVISPVFTYLLLMYASGIPMSEKRYDEKYGSQLEYVAYKRRTSPCIPMPTCIYESLSNSAKWLCCCEVPLAHSSLSPPLTLPLLRMF
jgi:hypothetical protein